MVANVSVDRYRLVERKSAGMSPIALWCPDCKAITEMDRHGNCEKCGCPEMAVTDRPASEEIDVAGYLRRQAVVCKEERSWERRRRWLQLMLAVTAVAGAAICVWAIAIAR
jgi:hypothetical protein